jgi:hypothetical protein
MEVYCILYTLHTQGLRLKEIAEIFLNLVIKALTELLLIVLEFYKRRFVFRFVCILYTVLYSTLLHLAPLRFQCVRGRCMG